MLTQILPFIQDPGVVSGRFDNVEAAPPTALELKDR